MTPIAIVSWVYFSLSERLPCEILGRPLPTAKVTPRNQHRESSGRSTSGCGMQVFPTRSTSTHKPRENMCQASAQQTGIHWGLQGLNQRDHSVWGAIGLIREDNSETQILRWKYNTDSATLLQSTFFYFNLPKPEATSPSTWTTVWGLQKDHNLDYNKYFIKVRGHLLPQLQNTRLWFQNNCGHG